MGREVERVIFAVGRVVVGEDGGGVVGLVYTCRAGGRGDAEVATTRARVIFVKQMDGGTAECEIEEIGGVCYSSCNSNDAGIRYYAPRESMVSRSWYCGKHIHN